MTSTSTAQPSPLPPDAHPARQTLAVAITPTSRHRPSDLASSHRTQTQASSPFSGTCLCARSLSTDTERGKGPCDSRDTTCRPSLRRFFSGPSESRSATYLSPSLFEHLLT